MKRLASLTSSQLVAVGTPTELERKKAFASALGQVVETLLNSATADECEEMLDRVTSAKSGTITTQCAIVTR